MIFALMRWWFRADRLRLLAVHAVDELDTKARAQLGPRLYEIFCASYGALSSEVVLDEIVFKPGGYLAVWVDASGERVGFASAKVDQVELDGRPHAVLRVGSYFVPGHRGGTAARAFALLVVLFYRFTHPFARVFAGIETLNPVSYRLTVDMFALAFPHRELTAPGSMVDLAQALAGARGLNCAPDRPFVVYYRDPAVHERSLRSSRIMEDLDAAYYLTVNPHYRAGHILLVIVPFTFSNIIASTNPPMKRALRWLTGRRVQPPLLQQHGESTCH
ncbi:hypothetical protein DB30_02241 [Enhygromyxa salina]|uniref:Uncharacterized protein n=1 Tax=Enhygromyxa salina TaxID=215803 RepID=A0A0C2CL60_9BACT|nr:hypothetical protein DB30_02241 [Enhygromyxa salina]